MCIESKCFMNSNLCNRHRNTRMYFDNESNLCCGIIVVVPLVKQNLDLL